MIKAAPAASGAIRAASAAGWVALVAALSWSYAEPLTALSARWRNDEDYSHGFLVPLFAVYLLWFRRSLLQGKRLAPNWLGVVPLALACVMRGMSAYYFYPLVDFYSLLPCLAGVALLAGGWTGFVWAWPAIAYLFFMIPLPGFASGLFSHPLQRIATISSTWLLQLLGVPAISQGNVIWLTSARIGVVEACSGLRMLMLFCAITFGASALIQRPLWEKAFVGVSALAIGVLTNIVRITVTAMFYEYGDAKLAEMVFHDLAGWLMMPVATLILFLELLLLQKILVVPSDHGPIRLQR